MKLYYVYIIIGYMFDQIQRHSCLQRKCIYIKFHMCYTFLSYSYPLTFYCLLPFSSESTLINLIMSACIRNDGNSFDRKQITY